MMNRYQWRIPVLLLLPALAAFGLACRSLAGTPPGPQPPSATLPLPSPPPGTLNTDTPLAQASQHLAEQMDRYHSTFDVYTDVGAAGNHFVMLGRIADDPGAVDIDPCWKENPRSGATAIRNVFRNTTGRNWGGWYFLNGVLTGDDRAPRPNWGDVPNAGIDLRGATRLTFWARGERGGEKIEFFMGGVGRNPHTGDPIKPYPDSTRRIPPPDTRFTLTPHWQQYTIDLTGADLSYILGGFGWVANAVNNPNGAIFYLDDIRYDKARLDEPRFILSYVTLPSEHPFDTVMRNVAFTYDNALALLAFMARGTEDDWRRAQLLADALVYAWANDRFYAGGWLRNAYQAGDLALWPGWTPNGRANTARMPGFWDCARQMWFEDRFQVSTHTGNVAWAMLALLNYYQQRGGEKYLAAAQAMGEWIEQRRQEGGFGGYRGGIEGWEKPSAEYPNDPVEVAWRSTEHNLDIYVAFTKLYEITGHPVWRERAEHARAFVEAMWNEEGGHYWTGTDEAGQINQSVIPLDVQAWSLLAFGPNERTRRAVAYAEEHLRATWGNYEGFDFNQDRDMPWFEGTAQMVVAYWALKDVRNARFYLNKLREVQATAPNGNGKGIVAAPADGLTTGFDWQYFNRLHIGATAWFIFAEQMWNLFWGTSVAPFRTYLPMIRR